MPKSVRVDSLVDENVKKQLKAIKKETNDKITPRYILEEFVKEYCSTTPKGIKLKIKELENKKQENNDIINQATKENIEIDIEIKTYKDMLNKTLDIYINDDLIKAVESISKICNDRNIEIFEDIPEVTFVQIAKANRIDIEMLKKEVKKDFI